MRVVCFPHFQSGTIYFELQMTIDSKQDLTDYISVSIHLTTPNYSIIKVADNSLCSPLKGKDGKYCVQHLFQLPIENGRYIVTIKIMGDGRLIDIGRESFSVIIAENNLCYIRDQRLSWRKESDSEVSVFDKFGNLIILRGRLKKVWELCNGKVSLNDMQQILDIPTTECHNLLDTLVQKSILSPLNKIKIITREVEYDFN